MSTNPTALVFLDTETLGLGIDDPIWEIAAIRREPDGTEVCALLADVQAIAAAETSSALDPHSDTPATVEAVSVAPGEDSSQCNSRAIGGPLGFRCERASGHDPEVGHLSHHPRRGDRLSWWDPKTLIAEGGE